METKHARHYLLTAFTIYEMLNNQMAVILYSSMFKKYRYSLNSVCDATPRNGLSRINSVESDFTHLVCQISTMTNSSEISSTHIDIDGNL